MSAQRIQRKRTPGWRKPEGAVIVDRTSRFGNPFTVADAIEAEYSNPRRAVVSHFRAWLEGHADYQDVYKVGGRVLDRRRILAELPSLKGKDLVCPCPSPEDGGQDHCHARVLMELANAEVSR